MTRKAAVARSPLRRRCLLMSVDRDQALISGTGRAASPSRTSSAAAGCQPTPHCPSGRSITSDWPWPRAVLQPRLGYSGALSLAHLPNRSRLDISQEPGTLCDWLEGHRGCRIRCGLREPKGKDVCEEDHGEVTRASNDVGDARLFRQGPECARTPVEGKEARDRLNALIEILAAGEQQPGHASRTKRREGCVVDSALVYDKPDHAFGLPVDKLIVELAAGGHAPKQQGSRGQFRMLSPAREGGQRLKDGLAAALGHVGVVFNEELVMRPVGQPNAHQGDLMLDCESPPHLVINFRATVIVRTRRKDRDGPKAFRAVRKPQPEFRLVIVVARRDDFIESDPSLLSASHQTGSDQDGDKGHGNTNASGRSHFVLPCHLVQQPRRSWLNTPGQLPGLAVCLGHFLDRRPRKFLGEVLRMSPGCSLSQLMPGSGVTSL